MDFVHSGDSNVLCAEVADATRMKNFLIGCRVRTANFIRWKVRRSTDKGVNFNNRSANCWSVTRVCVAGVECCGAIQVSSSSCRQDFFPTESGKASSEGRIHNPTFHISGFVAIYREGAENEKEYFSEFSAIRKLFQTGYGGGAGDNAMGFGPSGPGSNPGSTLVFFRFWQSLY